MPTGRELLESEDAERIGDLADLEVLEIGRDSEKRPLRVGVEDESRERAWLGV